jgi:hypothetical protein
MEERLDPIYEEADKEVFTDREDLLAYLDWWAGKIPVGQMCLAFQSQRRLGKTAILRRFCNRLFWAQGRVIPFYFQVPSKGLLLSELNDAYYGAFVQQYAAFLLRQPELARQKIERVEQLLPIVEATGHEPLQQDVRRYFNYPPDRQGRKWSDFVAGAPYRLGHRKKGPFFAIVLDEFPELNRSIFIDQDHQDRGIPIRDLGNTYYEYSTMAEASIIFSGSAVTLLTHQALKDFIGRYGTKKLGPLEEKEGANLGLKLAARHGITTNLEVATTVSQVCQGNPFYITCVFQSQACPAELLDAQTVERVVDFEVSEGQIHDFWSRHFEENMDKINEDRLARRIVLYLADHTGEYLIYKDLAQALGVEQQPVFDRLKLLGEADLVESTAYGVYKGIRDRMLRRHIHLSLRTEVEGAPPEQVTAEFARQLHEEVEQIGAMLRSIEGGLNYYLGRYAEVFVENVLHRFDGREVEAARFFLGREGTLRLPDFAEVYPTRTQMVSALPPLAPPSQGGDGRVIEFGWYREGETAGGWAVEVRNREEAFGLEDVETFLGALESMQKEHQLDVMQGWVHSRGGFTAEAQERLLAAGVLMTDLEGLRALVQEFHIA